MGPVSMSIHIILPESEGNFDDAADVAAYLGLAWDEFIRRSIFTMTAESYQVLPGMAERAAADIQRAADDLMRLPCLPSQETLEMPEPEGGPDLATVNGLADELGLERELFYSACVLAYTRRGLEIVGNRPASVRTSDMPEGTFGMINDDDGDD